MRKYPSEELLDPLRGHQFQAVAAICPLRRYPIAAGARARPRHVEAVSLTCRFCSPGSEAVAGPPEIGQLRLPASSVAGMTLA